MDKKLHKIIELSRNPMLVLEEQRILLKNAAMRELLPDVEIGQSACELIPAHILQEPAESFLSSAIIGGKSCSVSALRDRKELLLSFTALRPAAELRGCLSDSLMGGILSSLFSIRLATERLASLLNPDQPDAKKYLAILTHNFYSLNHKLSNLNTACALSENSTLMIPRCTDLVELCSGIVSTVGLLTRETGAPLEFLCGLENLSAIVDAPKVEQMILNLLSNSLMHTPKEGQIRLRLSTQNGSAVISVVDSGCGIEPDKMTTVFTTYENRLDEHSLSTTDTGGLGLGICRRIAELHSGALILESRPGEGTSVRVLLPLTPPGDTALRSDLPEYVNGGMEVILTELCDVLDHNAYSPAFLD